MSTLHFIIIYLAIVNITAFIMYGIDKWRAVSNRTSQGHRKSNKKKQKRRIPESTLLGIAIIGGSIGALAGSRYGTTKPFTRSSGMAFRSSSSHKW